MKMDLALNNQKKLICRKIQTINQPKQDLEMNGNLYNINKIQ